MRTIKSPPVAAPVPKPGCNVKSPPATSVPIALVPLIRDPTGAVLDSAFPTNIFGFFTTKFEFIVNVPVGTFTGLAVTLASVCIVNEVALSVAPITGQVPSKFVIVLEPMLIVSPVLIPSVFGVYVNVNV